MSCQVAVTVFPSDGRIRASGTIPPRSMLCFPVTALTRLNDLMANPAIKGTPVGSHKRTFQTFFCCRTNHFNHPLYIGFIKLKKTWKRALPVFPIKDGRNINMLFWLVNKKFRAQLLKKGRYLGLKRSTLEGKVHMGLKKIYCFSD